MGTLWESHRLATERGGAQPKGDIMAILSGSIEADVPIAFADREWTEFVFRNLYGNYAKGFADVAASINESDADSGTVKFETEGERLVKVSVELEYTARAGGDPGEEVSRAQARLDRDLER
jgi:hypothetical protein